MPGGDSYYSWQSPLATGLAAKCPRCGRGKLFTGLLTVRQTCERCGLNFAEVDSGDGPAVFLIFVLGAILVPLVLWVEFSFEPPFWIHVIIWTPLIAIGTIGLLRPMKAFMIAIQYKHKAGERGGTFEQE